MSKSTKEVKYNKATDKAGLSFNVNVTRNWLKKQLMLGGETIPKIRGAHIGLTAIIESLLMNIFNLVNAHLPKEKSSLYKVTLPALAYPLQLDNDFALLFKEHIANFQKNQDVNYADNFCISKSAINTYIEKQYGDNIQLDSKAYNLLVYLMLVYSVNITKTAQHLMRYAGKKTIEAEAFKTAVLIHTPETISNTIIMKLDDAMKNNVDIDKEDGSDKESINEDNKDNKDNEDNEDNEHNEHNEHNEDNRNSKHKSKKKSSKKDFDNKVDSDQDSVHEEASDSENDKSSKKSIEEVSDDNSSSDSDEPVIEVSKKKEKDKRQVSDSESEEKTKKSSKKAEKNKNKNNKNNKNKKKEE